MDKKGILGALIAHYTNGNKSQFAKILGIKPQTINTWDTRGTFDLELIYSKCEGVSAEWLLTGEGDMLKSGSSSVDGATSKAKKAEKTANKGEDPTILTYMREQAAAHREELREKDAAIEQKNQEIRSLDRQVAQLEGQNQYLTAENHRLTQQNSRLETELQHYRPATFPPSATAPASASSTPVSTTHAPASGICTPSSTTHTPTPDTEQLSNVG
jgi:DNA-binding transcriptional MerR regulator